MLPFSHCIRSCSSLKELQATHQQIQKIIHHHDMAQYHLTQLHKLLPDVTHNHRSHEKIHHARACISSAVFQSYPMQNWHYIHAITLKYLNSSPQKASYQKLAQLRADLLKISANFTRHVK